MGSNEPLDEDSEVDRRDAEDDDQPNADEARGAVVDTVVLLYFLLADEFALLLDLLGRPLRVPLVVLDVNEEPGTPPHAMSELTEAIDHEDRKSKDLAATEGERVAAAERRDKLTRVFDLVEDGSIEIVEMSPAELERFAALQDAKRAGEFGLVFVLDPGEAACLAIAIERNLVLATDDGDALKALAKLSSEHGYERIRKLLRRAADEGRITQQQANDIHGRMRELGFWDREHPFPDLPGDAA